MLGFDTGYFFLKGLSKYGSELEKNLPQMDLTPIQTGFKFQRVNNWGGFVNKKVFFVHFTKNFELIKLDFEMKRDQLKSLLLGAILLAGITLPAKAQIGEQRHNFAIGINGGANYSTVSFQPTIKQNGLLGITGGVTARYISEKYFAMICGAQLELNFSQRGWDEKFDPEQGFSSEDSYVRTMNYLEIPFLAHLAFGKDKGVQFS